MSEVATTLPPTHKLKPVWYENFRNRLEERVPSRLTRRLAATAMTALPLLGAAAAINHGPAKEINVAGATVEISTQLGRNYTSLEFTHDGNERIRRQNHASFLDKTIGVSATADKRDITPGLLQQVAADSEPLIGRVREAAISYSIERASEGFGGVLIAELGGLGLYLYGGRRLRRTAATTAITLGVITGYTGITSLTYTDHQTIVGSSFLNNTPLEGTEIDVEPSTIASILDQLPRGKDAKFYPDAAEQVKSLLEASPELNEEGWSNLVLVDDLQGNKGAAQIVGTAANTLGAPLIITGDLTNFATKPEEEYIIDTLTHYAEPDETHPIYFIAALHDTQSVIDYAKERGFVMPDGQKVTINGVTFMGYNDPRISNISQFKDGNSLRNPAESVEQFIQRMREDTCAERPDFAVTHDHLLAEELTQTGCTALVIGARTFDDTSETSYAPATTGYAQSAKLILGSGGGHDTTNIFSPDLERPAQFVVLQTNQATGAARSLIVSVDQKGKGSLTSPFELIPPDTIVEAQPVIEGGEAPKAEGKREAVR